MNILYIFSKKFFKILKIFTSLIYLKYLGKRKFIKYIKGISRNYCHEFLDIDNLIKNIRKS